MAMDDFAPGFNAGLNLRRLMDERAQYEAAQIIAEKERAAKERERQATLAQTTMRETMDDIANGTPAEAAVARAKAIYKAHGIEASPSIRARDPNHPSGGGYEFNGFLPGQEEAIVADPRKLRQERAANRAAAIAATQGLDPEAEGLMASEQQRALQGPQGQQYMRDQGGILGMAAGSMAGGAPGMLFPSFDASAGAAGGSAAATSQGAGQALAPSDSLTAVAQQADLMGDHETLAYLRGIAQMRPKLENAQELQRLKNAGTMAVAKERRASSLEVTLKRLEKKRAGGGGVGLRDIETLRKDYAEHKNEYKTAEDNYQKTLNEFQQAQQPKAVVNQLTGAVSLVPPNQATVAEVAGRLARLKAERDDLRTAVDAADTRYGNVLEARYGKKGEKKPGDKKAPETPAAPGGAPAQDDKLQAVKVKAKGVISYLESLPPEKRAAERRRAVDMMPALDQFLPK
jgi:hypothetical protein